MIQDQHHLTPLGKIFVDDPDDWDSNQKIWKWHSAPNSLFILDERTGQIAMKANVPDGRYVSFIDYIAIP